MGTSYCKKIYDEYKDYTFNLDDAEVGRLLKKLCNTIEQQDDFFGNKEFILGVIGTIFNGIKNLKEGENKNENS